MKQIGLILMAIFIVASTLYSQNVNIPDVNLQNSLIKEGVDTNGARIVALADFEGVNWTVYHTTNSGLPDNAISSIAIDSDGTKWIGTWNGGLAAFNENGIPDRILVIEAQSQLVHVYPNPTNDLITIDTEYPDHYYIQITSLNGQQILNGEMEGTSRKINLSYFQKGVYIITIRSLDFVTTEKILKLLSARMT